MNTYKYPRTPHFSFSPGATSDDRILLSDDVFIGKNIVITEKMDGENTTVYNYGCHARSLDSKHMEYHSWLLNYIANFAHLLEPDMRICGEYLFAKHSIFYDQLTTYFSVFSIWHQNLCFSWRKTKEICAKYGLETVPELYVGPYDVNTVKKVADSVVASGGEGIVVRNEGEFLYEDFGNNVAKYVRQNHVQTDQHWKSGAIIQNKVNYSVTSNRASCFNHYCVSYDDA